MKAPPFIDASGNSIFRAVAMRCNRLLERRERTITPNETVELVLVLAGAMDELVLMLEEGAEMEGDTVPWAEH